MMPRIETTPLAGLGAIDVPGRRPAMDPALEPAFAAHGPAAQRNLERLCAGASCVTTGQQPGLFTGPLLTIHKALSAVALAERCERILQRPVVPVFWVAGDDHDFAESNHTHLLNLDNEVQRIELRARGDAAPAVPMFREPLGPEVEDAIRRIGELTPDTEFRDAQLDWIRRHYRPDRTVASAFAAALAELLGGTGLVVFRPTAAAAKRAAAPIVVKALEEAGAIDQRVRDYAVTLEEAGHPLPVAVSEGNTMVMVDGAAGRDRLIIDALRFVSRRASERWTLDGLRRIASESPERLSPNVLLRPVVEAAILPTLAYVAGPAERAYIRQATPIYEILGVAPQQIVVRWSGRIVEKRVAKILEKYGLDPDDLAAPDGQLEGRLASRGVPDAAQEALRALRAALQTHYATLADAATAVDPTLKKPVQSQRAAALAGLTDVEKRLVSHLKKNDEILMRQIATARNALFPLGKAQERVLNVLQYTIRYGDAIHGGVLAACRQWAERLETGGPEP